MNLFWCYIFMISRYLEIYYLCSEVFGSFGDKVLWFLNDFYFLVSLKQLKTIAFFGLTNPISTTSKILDHSNSAAQPYCTTNLHVIPNPASSQLVHNYPANSLQSLPRHSNQRNSMPTVRLTIYFKSSKKS